MQRYLAIISLGMLLVADCRQTVDPLSPKVVTRIDLDHAEKHMQKEKLTARIIYNNENFMSGTEHQDGFIPWTANLIQGPDSTLLIFDFKQSRIVQLSEDGEFLGSIGGPGSGPGEFMEPNPYLIRSDRNIFIPDTYGMRLQVFDHNGKYLRVITHVQLEDGCFAVGRGNTILSAPPHSFPPAPYMILMRDSCGLEVGNLGSIKPDDDIIGDKHRRSRYRIAASESSNIIWCILRYKPIIRKYDYNGRFLEEIIFSSAAIDDAYEKGQQYLRNHRGQNVVGGGMLIINHFWLLPDGDLILNITRHGNIWINNNDQSSILQAMYEFVDLPRELEAISPNRLKLVQLNNQFFAFEERGIIIKAMKAFPKIRR